MHPTSGKEISRKFAGRIRWVTKAAMSHHAWTFDPDEFHDWLEERIVEDGELHLDKLHELATGIFRNASPVTRDALGWMRLGDELYVDMSDPEVDYSIRWYMITLASWLHPAPSLPGWDVLRIVLPLAGWSFEEIRLLTSGRPWGTLAQASGNELFAAEFDWIWDYGWLDLTTVEDLLDRLLDAEDLVLSPPGEGMEKLLEWAEEVSRDPQEMLMMTYLTTREMLYTALNREQALLMALD
jgi:hypothetical protein